MHVFVPADERRSEGIVEAHGGRIWVDDPVSGEGATFRLTLRRKLSGEK